MCFYSTPVTLLESILSCHLVWSDNRYLPLGGDAPSHVHVPFQTFPRTPLFSRSCLRGWCRRGAGIFPFPQYLLLRWVSGSHGSELRVQLVVYLGRSRDGFRDNTKAGGSFSRSRPRASTRSHLWLQAGSGGPGQAGLSPESWPAGVMAPATRAHAGRWGSQATLGSTHTGRRCVSWPSAEFGAAENTWEAGLWASPWRRMTSGGPGIRGERPVHLENQKSWTWAAREITNSTPTREATTGRTRLPPRWGEWLHLKIDSEKPSEVQTLSGKNSEIQNIPPTPGQQP